MPLSNIGGFKVYHNSQGDWTYQIIYDRTNKNFAVVVYSIQLSERTVIGQAGSFLEGEELFNNWLATEDNSHG
jgi:hypothetical protein